MYLEKGLDIIMIGQLGEPVIDWPGAFQFLVGQIFAGLPAAYPSRMLLMA